MANPPKLSFEEVPQAISEIKEKLDALSDQLRDFRQLYQEKAQEQLLTPAEVCMMLKISKPTLESWSREVLQKHYVGGRVYYKYCEVMSSLKSLKKYKRSPLQDVQKNGG